MLSPFKKMLVQHQVELKSGLVRVWQAVAREKPALKIVRERFEAVSRVWRCPDYDPLYQHLPRRCS